MKAYKRVRFVTVFEPVLVEVQEMCADVDTVT